MAQQQVVGWEPPRIASERSALGVARSILEELFGPPGQRGFAVRYWDGSEERPAQPAAWTLVLRRPGALRRMLWPPTDLTLGEAYLRDDFDIEGDIVAAAGLADHLLTRLRSPRLATRLLVELRHLPQDDAPPPAPTRRFEQPWWLPRHARRRDAQAVRHHYDVGNDFYALWLDRRMVYSCAYFPTGAEDIDAAQEAKLELICRKLRLQPGERLLDIGCGWGGLIIYAAERYGVEALGITLSHQQAALARERIAQAGLEGRCRVEVCDYRELRGLRFDKVVSVGMFEHVGAAKQPIYFAKAYELTRPGGLFLNHGIVTRRWWRSEAERVGWRVLGPHTSFVQRYVFPDGELVPIGEAVQVAEAAGFEARDLENLREHYVLTLRHWVRRLEQHHDTAARLVGETTYRIWRLYMAGSAHAFQSGRIAVTQLLLSRPDATGRTHLPLTRADIYAA
ncbi:class I SAM-dependent methyltransferase [Kallotenue papyrolyticum]|uniref:class I SAM-dependent methyltransferase n=1 Tax=Kallotenue papyrolyticum TaxID=1325125 RepID=UPI0004785DA9|nr:cyclopropane-fatty-acyl-phospholipid synthase family protein [Kallotenue papyrolyticum]